MGTATTPNGVPWAALDPAVGVGVADAADAGTNPLNWLRETPDDAARPLNWLSNEDSSASISVGLWTLGIWVAIFSRSAQLFVRLCFSDLRESA